LLSVASLGLTRMLDRIFPSVLATRLPCRAGMPRRLLFHSRNNPRLASARLANRRILCRYSIPSVEPKQIKSRNRTLHGADCFVQSHKTTAVSKALSTAPRAAGATLAPLTVSSRDDESSRANRTVIGSSMLCSSVLPPSWKPKLTSSCPV